MPSVRPVDALPAAQLPRGEVDAAHGALAMADLWSMTLADVRSPDPSNKKTVRSDDAAS
jgi:hypothetical protein